MRKLNKCIKRHPQLEIGMTIIQLCVRLMVWEGSAAVL